MRTILGERKWLVVAWVALAAWLAAVATGCAPAQPPAQNAEQKAEQVEAPSAEQGLSVTILQKTGAYPSSAKLSVLGGRDHVRWINSTARRCTLSFTTTWPFKEDRRTIQLAPSDTSEWFSLNTFATRKAHFYHVSPAADSTGPDEPDVTAGN
jgi:hypothetical protein